VVVGDTGVGKTYLLDRWYDNSSTYSPLRRGEGYEILRATEGQSKELLLIPMPPNGFSVSYLQSVLGQAKGYLRPLQRDIMETSRGINSSPDQV